MEGQRRGEEDRKERELWLCLSRTLEVWAPVTGTSCRRRAVTRGPVCWRFSHILGSRGREMKLPLGQRSVSPPTNILDISIFRAVRPALAWVRVPSDPEALFPDNRRPQVHEHSEHSVILTETSSSLIWQLMGSAWWLIVMNGSPFITHCALGPALSALQGLKNGTRRREGGRLLPPVGREISLAALGKVYFWLQISRKTELSWWQRGLEGTDGRTGQRRTRVVS